MADVYTLKRVEREKGRDGKNKRTVLLLRGSREELKTTLMTATGVTFDLERNDKLLAEEKSKAFLTGKLSWNKPYASTTRRAHFFSRSYFITVISFTHSHFIWSAWFSHRMSTNSSLSDLSVNCWSHLNHASHMSVVYKIQILFSFTLSITSLIVGKKGITSLSSLLTYSGTRSHPFVL